MRIFNATDSQLSLPFMGKQRLTISPHAVSGDIMGSTDFLSILVTSYNTDEIAIIVSGPYEINVCATVPTAVNYVVSSLDEAIQRFNPPKPEPEPGATVVAAAPAPKEEEPVEDPKVEEPKDQKLEDPEVVEPKPEVKPKAKAAPKKSKGGKKK